jgi:hypothetical protein
MEIEDILSYTIVLFTSGPRSTKIIMGMHGRRNSANKIDICGSQSRDIAVGIYGPGPREL